MIDFDAKIEINNKRKSVMIDTHKINDAEEQRDKCMKHSMIQHQIQPTTAER